MAYSLVQNPTAANGGGTSIAKAFSSNVVAGNTLVAFATTDPNTTHTYSSSGDTWTTIGPFFNSVAGQSISIGVCLNATGGAKTVTCTFGATGIFNGIIIAEFSGTSSGIDTNTAGQHLATSTTPTDSTMTIGNDNELIVSYIILDSSGSTTTAGSGFTLLTQDTTDLASAEYQVQTSKTNVAPSFNQSVSVASGIISAAIKPATGGTTPPPNYLPDIPVEVIFQLLIDQQNRVISSTAGPDQTVNADGIITGEQVGTPLIAPVITGDGIPSSEQVGTPSISATYTISADGIVTGEQLGNPTTVLFITAQGIPSSEQVGTPSLSVAISGQGIPTAEQVGTPTITTTYTVNAQGIPSAEVFGTPSVGQSVTPQGIPTAEQVGTPTVSATYTISAQGIPSAERVGTPTTTLFITTAGIPSAEVVGVPGFSIIVAVNAFGVPSAEQLGSPTVTPGSVTVTAAGIPSAERAGSPTVTAAGAVISPAGIPSAEALGKISITTGPVTVAVHGIPTSEAFGRTQVSLGFITQNIAAAGITSGERLGSGYAGVQVDIDIIAGTGIPQLIWVDRPALTSNVTPDTLVNVDEPALPADTSTPTLVVET